MANLHAVGSLGMGSRPSLMGALPRQKFLEARREQRVTKCCSSMFNGSGASIRDSPIFVVEQCLDLSARGDPDSILEFLPGEVRQKCEQAKTTTFGAVFPIGVADKYITLADAAHVAPPDKFFADSYALRALEFRPLASCEVQSAMRLTQGKYLARCAVQAGSGERMQLTFELEQESRVRLVEAEGEVVRQWVLRSITGEPARLEEGEGPEGPSPQWGPETIVEAQLQAFRLGALAAAFQFAAPRPGMVHPLDGEELLAQAALPLYRRLLHHEKSVLRAITQHSATSAIILVGIKPCRKQCELEGLTSEALYQWNLELQLGQGPFRNCWMTRAIRVFN